MNWTLFDYLAFGGMVGVAGLIFTVAASRPHGFLYKLAASLAVGAAFLLVWAVLAVGALGEPGDPADLMYGLALLIGLVGGALVRLQPRGMVRVALAMAAAHAAIAGIALILGKHRTPVSSVFEVLAVNGLFVALFGGAAALFWLSARRDRIAAA